jgi:hypothetical protein
MLPDVACAYIDAASPVAITKMARLLKTFIKLLPDPAMRAIAFKGSLPLPLVPVKPLLCHCEIISIINKVLNF